MSKESSPSTPRERIGMIVFAVSLMAVPFVITKALHKILARNEQKGNAHEIHR